MLHHPAPGALTLTQYAHTPYNSINHSCGTGCPVEQHRWRDAGPPRDLKRRFNLTHTAGGSQCVKSRHSIKYDSSSNLYRTFITDQPAVISSSVGGARPSRHSITSCFTGEGALQFAGTSASAIKVACTPISSPSQINASVSVIIGRFAVPLACTHTHTSSLLSDPMNDRSKDCAPRGTLHGSCGS